MTKTTTGRSAWLYRTALAIAIVLVLGTATVALIRIPLPFSLQNQTLVRDLSRMKPSEGRFLRSRSLTMSSEVSRSFLGQAQVRLLSSEDSFTRQRIQSLIHMVQGNWQRAADGLTQLNDSYADAEIIIDLGVSYLALGQEDPINYFKALELFERAKRLAPSAPAPRFNTILVARKVGLRDLEQQEWKSYARLETDANWF